MSTCVNLAEFPAHGTPPCENENGYGETTSYAPILLSMKSQIQYLSLSLLPPLIRYKGKGHLRAESLNGFINATPSSVGQFVLRFVAFSSPSSLSLDRKTLTLALCNKLFPRVCDYTVKYGKEDAYRWGARQTK